MIETQPANGTSSSVVHADVGIIGAGPAGLATALHLGQLGVKRVVIADRCAFPRDKTCGSAISPKGRIVLDQLGLSDAVGEHAYVRRQCGAAPAGGWRARPRPAFHIRRTRHGRGP